MLSMQQTQGVGTVYPVARCIRSTRRRPAVRPSDGLSAVLTCASVPGSSERRARLLSSDPSEGVRFFACAPMRDFSGHLAPEREGGHEAWVRVRISGCLSLLLSVIGMCQDASRASRG